MAADIMTWNMNEKKWKTVNKEDGNDSMEEVKRVLDDIVGKQYENGRNKCI